MPRYCACLSVPAFFLAFLPFHEHTGCCAVFADRVHGVLKALCGARRARGTSPRSHTRGGRASRTTCKSAARPTPAPCMARHPRTAAWHDLTSVWPINPFAKTRPGFVCFRPPAFADWDVHTSTSSRVCVCQSRPFRYALGLCVTHGDYVLPWHGLHSRVLSRTRLCARGPQLTGVSASVDGAFKHGSAAWHTICLSFTALRG